MRKVLTGLFCLLSSFSIGQVNLDWAVGLYGNSSIGEGAEGVCDKEGNSYICGNFLGNIDFNPGPEEFLVNSSISLYNLQPSLDAFVLKLDSSGNFLWALIISADENENAWDITFDADSNLVVCGEYRGQLNYLIQGIPNSIYSSNNTGFISKFSRAGEILEMKTVISSNGPDKIRCIGLDPYGSIWAGLASSAKVQRLSADLNYQDEYIVLNTQSPSTISRIEDIAFQSNGDAIIIAQVIYTNFELGYEFIVQRLDNSGNEIWTNVYGQPGLGSAASGFTRCAIDPFNDIYIGGQFRGTVDFGFGNETTIPNNNTSGNAYLLKIDGNGLPIWFKKFTNGYSSIYDINTDSVGGIYFSGDIQGEIIFQQPNFIIPSGIMEWNGDYGESIFSGKINSDGEVIWIAPVIGNSGGSIAYGQWLGNDNSIYSTGYYSGSSDFDPQTNSEYILEPYCNLNLNSCTDPFIRKLKQCMTMDSITLFIEGSCESFVATLTAPIAESYLWNSGETTQSISVNSFGTYFVQIQSQTDCIQIVYPLTISASDLPLIEETCNTIDDDCDGQIDEGFDLDNDNYTTCNGDCDDTNESIYPGALEVCNDSDDNCNDIIDEDFDLDNDNYTTCNGDCDDTNESIYPGAIELCNDIDDNCNDNIDEGFDLDNDNHTTCNGDCDDTNANVYPGAIEIPDLVDNNCDGQIDEGFNPDLDEDDDGFSTENGDCNDNNPNINPDAIEQCNGIDDNCNSFIDEGFDIDGDGETTCAGDCNDNDASVNTSAIEICNSVDDDCDTYINEELACNDVNILVPNGISPNGDGLNDAWYLPWLDGLNNYSIVISNRWGQVVFQTSEYTTPWEGKYQDNPLPSADYFYLIRLSDNTILEGVISIKY